MSVMSINPKINNETNRDNNGKHNCCHYDNKYYILRMKILLRSRTLTLRVCESWHDILQGVVHENTVWNYSHQWLRISVEYPIN